MIFSYLDEERIRITSDLVSRYDRDLKVVGWNPACARRWNIPEEQAIARFLDELFPHIPVQQDYRYVCLSEAARHGKSFYFSNLPYRYTTGTYYQAIVPLKGKNEEIIGVMNVVRESQYVSGPISKRDLLMPLVKNSSFRVN